MEKLKIRIRNITRREIIASEVKYEPLFHPMKGCLGKDACEAAGKYIQNSQHVNIYWSVMVLAVAQEITVLFNGLAKFWGITES